MRQLAGVAHRVGQAGVGVATDEGVRRHARQFLDVGPHPARNSDRWPVLTRPTSRVAAVMQAGQYRDALLVQQFEMQCVRKSSQQDPAKPAPCGRKGLWVAR